MLRIILTQETDGQNDFKSVYVDDNDTPCQLLYHYRINPKTKNVYLNGQLLSSQAINKTFKELSKGEKLFVAVRYKT